MFLCCVSEVFSSFEAVLLFLEVVLRVLYLANKDRPKSFQHSLLKSMLIAVAFESLVKHSYQNFNRFLNQSFFLRCLTHLLQLLQISKRKLTYLELNLQKLLDLFIYSHETLLVFCSNSLSFLQQSCNLFKRRLGLFLNLRVSLNNTLILVISVLN